jgi:hypothetical protein
MAACIVLCLELDICICSIYIRTYIFNIWDIY